MTARTRGGESRARTSADTAPPAAGTSAEQQQYQIVTRRRQRLIDEAIAPIVTRTRTRTRTKPAQSKTTAATASKAIPAVSKARASSPSQLLRKTRQTAASRPGKKQQQQQQQPARSKRQPRQKKADHVSPPSSAGEFTLLVTPARTQPAQPDCSDGRDNSDDVESATVQQYHQISGQDEDQEPVTDPEQQSEGAEEEVVDREQDQEQPKQAAKEAPSSSSNQPGTPVLYSRWPATISPPRSLPVFGISSAALEAQNGSQRSVRFSKHSTVLQTYSPCEYDRKVAATAIAKRKRNIITSENWRRMLGSLDEYKLKEMPVHHSARSSVRLYTKKAVMQQMEIEARSSQLDESTMEDEGESVLLADESDSQAAEDASFASSVWQDMSPRRHASRSRPPAGDENRPPSRSPSANNTDTKQRGPFAPLGLLGSVVSSVKTALVSPFRSYASHSGVDIGSHVVTDEENPFAT
ncbi:hypothetical protein RI367_008247 [Sorochytrium milnesiophthora]